MLNPVVVPHSDQLQSDLHHHLQNVAAGVHSVAVSVGVVPQTAASRVHSHTAPAEVAVVVGAVVAKWAGPKGKWESSDSPYVKETFA